MENFRKGKMKIENQLNATSLWRWFVYPGPQAVRSGANRRSDYRSMYQLVSNRKPDLIASLTYVSHTSTNDSHFKMLHLKGQKREWRISKKIKISYVIESPEDSSNKSPNQLDHISF